MSAKADDAPWLRWEQSAFVAAKLHLESLRQDQFTLDDWLLTAEFIVQRYAADGAIKTSEEYNNVKAALLRKLKANMPDGGTLSNFKKPVQISPNEALTDGLTASQHSILQAAKDRACDYMEGATDAQRVRMRAIIERHVKAQMLNLTGGNARSLRESLFASFAVFNLDWEQIATTEMGEAANQGFIASVGTNHLVIWIAPYAGACAFCESLEGRIFTVVPADMPDKNLETEVWVGKTNLSRDATPCPRGSDEQIEPSENQPRFAGAGLQRPLCRGSWMPVVSKPPEVSQAFHDWAMAKLEAAAPTSRLPKAHP